MNFAIFKIDREDSSNSIVGGISLHNQLTVGDPMSENRSISEGLLSSLKAAMHLSSNFHRVPLHVRQVKGITMSLYSWMKQW